MDALANYESDSDSNEPAAGSGVTRHPKTEPQPAPKLPNPFAPRPVASAAGRAAGAKRSVAPAPLRAGPASKAPRVGAAQAAPGRTAQPGAPLFRPPQLQGRANVVTEDLDKLFAKRRAAQKRAVEPG
ncbi:hypothetical protein WJX81_006846 [Elliptochloris bilobata]|uniref:Translation initiation factor IF-2 n=1 Tax=Elliptochloris bilobata TaxID=381761 RepID=A0AAW1QIY8_9CHLO